MKNRYFLDTEFAEGCQTKRFFGIPYGKTKPTIDLISIGIVNGEGREYYAISKDFNLKEAWNRYQKDVNKNYPSGPEYIKNYWIRENVLKPIYAELRKKEIGHKYKASQICCSITNVKPELFCYKSLKRLIKKYGKSNKRIATELKDSLTAPFNVTVSKPIEFYGYFADYDWTVFCWLFGLMIDLPKGFPYYCMDLKQMMQERGLSSEWKRKFCPDPENEHNALADAKWNLELFKQIVATDKNTKNEDSN